MPEEAAEEPAPLSQPAGYQPQPAAIEDEIARQEAAVSAEGGGAAVGERTGEGDAAGEEEEAVAVRPARTPCSPTRAEREEHEATHLPFRSWCRFCVSGRSDNPAHRVIEDPDGERRGLLEVHLDYAYLKRDSSDDLLTLLVVKFRPSRAVRAYSVPAKGVGDAAIVERVCRGMVEAGVRAPCIVKSDGEASIRALRDELLLRAGEGAVPQESPAGESESNGAVEVGIKHVKGLIRVHILALEAKLGCTIPVTHPIMTWIVEAVSDIMSKHLEGQRRPHGFRTAVREAAS